MIVLNFSTVVYQNGDIYDRYMVRIRRDAGIHEDSEAGPGTDFLGARFSTARGMADSCSGGKSYSRVENPKGKLGFYVVSDGGVHPYRFNVRGPSFINLTPLEHMCKGHLVADIIAMLGSIDIVLGETDR